MKEIKKKFRISERERSEKWLPNTEPRFAAVDIGSNGVRLLLSRVLCTEEFCTFTKESLIRMPIRLGADVFSTGRVSAEREGALVSTMQAFKHLLDAYGPVDYRACATSAMREAENGEEIVNKIREKSGLDLEIIGGGMEAEIIFSSHVAETLNPEKAYLYIDVGGGSTELTFFADNNRLKSKSFPIGTVRLLNGLVEEHQWDKMKKWVRKNKPEGQKLHAIGSGGNMNKIYRLANKKQDKPVTYNELKDIDKLLNRYNFEERIRLLHLRPDRADVIIHAMRIFRSIMKWGDAGRIYVPQFGLADGLVHLMHDAYVKKGSH